MYLFLKIYINELRSNIHIYIYMNYTKLKFTYHDTNQIKIYI